MGSANENLGVMYYQGLGVPQDYAKAMELLRPQAESGSPGAEFYLALMYKSGLGVPKDAAKAAQWMSKAAEWGLVPAQLEYGAMLRDADGVPRDYAAAYQWFLLAAERGGPENKASAVEAQASVRKHLSAEQIAQIQADVAAWIAQHPPVLPMHYSR
jgi:TPR repeat protein